jgi:hypothetical protein
MFLAFKNIYLRNKLLISFLLYFYYMNASKDSKETFLKFKHFTLETPNFILLPYMYI